MARLAPTIMLNGALCFLSMPIDPKQVRVGQVLAELNRLCPLPHQAESSPKEKPHEIRTTNPID